MYNLYHPTKKIGIAVVQSTMDAHGGISTRTKVFVSL